MAFTRTQYRTRTLRRMDGEASDRWDDTAGPAGEIDQVLGVEHDRAWRKILNANPYYRMSKRTPTSDASGRYAISDLSSGSGDSAERFYRVIEVLINNRRYPFEHRTRDHLLAQEIEAQAGYYCYQEGDYLIAMPLSVSTQATGIWVNHLPTRIDNLSADSSDVTFPDGYEDIVCLRAAARLLRKGGAEVTAADVLDVDADELEGDMLADLKRFSVDPLRVEYGDSSADWGG